MLVCLPCCLLLSGLLLSLASVSFRSCEDSFDYVRLSSSWTRSSSLRDLSARWPLPSISLLSLLPSCFILLLWCATYHLLFKPPKLPCQPLTFSPFLANHCLAMLPLLLSPLIALLVAGELEDCSMMDMIMLGYHNISYLINASIYLVKGGRLSLMPGVLFHSCRPSFRHTGVMFLDFAFLTRLGYNGNPLTVCLE